MTRQKDWKEEIKKYIHKGTNPDQFKNLVGFIESLQSKTDIAEKKRIARRGTIAPSPFENKNDYKIDAKGELIFDEKCRNCDAPHLSSDLQEKELKAWEDWRIKNAGKYKANDIAKYFLSRIAQVRTQAEQQKNKAVKE